MRALSARLKRAFDAARVAFQPSLRDGNHFDWMTQR